MPSCHDFCSYYVTMYTDSLRSSSCILSRDKTRLWSRKYSPIYFRDPNNGNLDLSLSRLSTFGFLLSYSKLNIIFVVVVKSVCHVWLFCDPMDCSLPARLFCPWDFPGKNTGVDCHALLQGIFATQESNLHLVSLLHSQACSLPLQIRCIYYSKKKVNCGLSCPF